MANPFVHLELRTNDPAKAKSFYSALFDWKLDEIPMQTSATGPTASASGPNPYISVDVGERGVGGGIMRNPDEGEPSWWLAYVEVADVADATKKAKSLAPQFRKRSPKFQA